MASNNKEKEIQTQQVLDEWKGVSRPLLDGDKVSRMETRGYCRILILVVDSSGDPFTGIGTASNSFSSSGFSSSLIGMYLNSSEREKTLKRSIISI